MFRKKLEECLTNIFELPKVRYGAVAEGSEQDVIFCNINTVKGKPADGGYYFRVTGTIGINAEAVNYKYGYLKDRIIFADKKYKKYFGFSSVETNVTFSDYENDFVKPELNFTFRVTLPYNPASAKITYEKTDFNIIKENKG